MPRKLTNRFELLSSHWLKRSNGDALPLSYVSIIQKCLHPLIVFEFCYSLHLCIKSRLGQKSTMLITKRSVHLLSIVKFAVLNYSHLAKPTAWHLKWEILGTSHTYSTGSKWTFEQRLRLLTKARPGPSSFIGLPPKYVFKIHTGLVFASYF